MTNILLVYYAKIYLCTAQQSLISTEHSSSGFTTKKNNPCNIYHWQFYTALHCTTCRYNAINSGTTRVHYYKTLIHWGSHVIEWAVKYIIFTREKLSNNLVLIYVQLRFCGGFNLNPDQTGCGYSFKKLCIFFSSRSHWSSVLNSKLLSEMLRFLGFWRFAITNLKDNLK